MPPGLGRYPAPSFSLNGGTPIERTNVRALGAFYIDQILRLDLTEGVGKILAIPTLHLGTEADARALLLRVLASPAAAVLDADALNLLAADRRLALRPPVAAPDQSPRVLTPHPLEAARLADCSAAEIQRDRTGAASALAGRYDAIVVLKGAGTVVARPDGRWAIIDAGGPALATAGTGDVLAGVIGSLLAQRLSAWDASLLGCWVHGNAGDRWRAVGLSAAELPGLVRESLAALTETPT